MKTEENQAYLFALLSLCDSITYVIKIMFVSIAFITNLQSNSIWVIVFGITRLSLSYILYLYNHIEMVKEHIWVTVKLAIDYKVAVQCYNSVTPGFYICVVNMWIRFM